MNTVSLNGKWLVTYTEARPEKNSPLPDFSDGIIMSAVPGYWEDMLEDFAMAPFWKNMVFNPDYRPVTLPISGNVPDMVLETVVGTFWYKRELLPVATEKKQVFIKFAGVQNRALVFINGVFAGEHCGYSAPFDINITEYLSDNENNEVVLAISNHQAYNEKGAMISGCTSRAANRYTGGIMGDVVLEIKPENSILDAYVTGYDEESDSFDVVTTLSENQSSDILWEIYDGDLLLKKGQASNTDFSVKKEELSLWSTKNPKLYTLKLSYKEDTHIITFGIRSIGVDGCKITLNGKRVFLRGICEHGYFAKTVHPTNDINYYIKAIKKLKELDFNFIRFHTWIPVEEYMTAADRLGILLHVESPNNTTEAEWEDIIRFVRHHPSVVICCTGNEMLVDDEEIEHIERCAELVHREGRGILFSPMNALRGVEYCWNDEDYGTPLVEKPFKHNPRRLEKLRSFSDIFSSFAHGQLSYISQDGNPEEIDSWQDVLKLPRISHEICIHGTWVDLGLEKRYDNSRIGKTDIYAGPRRMLEKLGLIDRAPVYYNNSCMWQMLMRKHTFENARLTKTLAGYDYLGDIDHHWHTSGYRVGMMNEFYELKPGETVENVRRYNSESVVLTSLATKRTYYEQSELSLDFFTSLYGEENLENGMLSVRFETSDRTIISRHEFKVSAKCGETEKIATLTTTLPKAEKPIKLNIFSRVSGGIYELENKWEIWVYPKVLKESTDDIIVTRSLDLETLKKLESGADVLMLGTHGLASNPVSFRITFPGRSAGNLATVIENHPITDAFEHDGYCDWQFSDLMTDATCLWYTENCRVPFEPIIDIASSYKWVRRQSLLSEFKVGKGRLLISTFNTAIQSPATEWWVNNLAKYMKSEKFEPKINLTLDELSTLFEKEDIQKAVANSNFARNENDKTMTK